MARGTKVISNSTVPATDHMESDLNQEDLADDADFLEDTAAQAATIGAATVPVTRPNVWKVRVYPYNPNKGHLRVRTCIDHCIYDAEAGWYDVTDLSHVEKLKAERQDSENPNSPPVFEVLSPDEAMRVDARERNIASGNYVPPQEAQRPEHSDPAGTASRRMR